MSDGTLVSITISDGGVPKRSRDVCVVRLSGLEGDRQRDLRYHGGPDRAVCLYSLDLIQALQSEGHPIEPGAIGENLTLSGVPWEAMTPGACLSIGAVVVELTSYADPCRTIAGAFQRGEYGRVSRKAHPGWSRLYARVTTPGVVSVGDPVHVMPAQGAI